MRKQRRTTKDFHVRVLEDDRMFPTIPEADIGLDVYLEDFEAETDLPDSDRIMICQRKGINEDNCLRR
ncbi:MAG: hypothetical protein IJ778_05560 [Alphaproteobacteria bacterium]|nr:hypothetical protein [Alphaproteobacteria bacterium]